MKKVEDQKQEIKKDQLATPPTVKNYRINWDKVKSVKDISLIFRALNMAVSVTGDKVPENLKPLFDRNFLKEIK